MEQGEQRNQGNKGIKWNRGTGGTVEGTRRRFEGAKVYRQQGTVLRYHLLSTLEALNLLPAVHEVPNYHAGLGLGQDKQRAVLDRCNNTLRAQ